MLSPAAPWWLLGLVLLPAIRWLHRGGRHRRAVAVSRLGLWRGAAASQPAAGERRPPDPAWRRRALLAALLFIALAEPQLPVRHPGITLWVDDSISMLTREVQGTRLALGVAQVRAALADGSHGEVEVRGLADPWHSLGTLSDAVAAGLVAGAGRKEPNPPPAALLRRDRLHWLLTDGADAGLLDWPVDRHADRVFQVAGVTRNVGIERLSARRSVRDPEQFDLLLKLTNGGDAAETREIVFATDAGELARSSQRLEPGASALVRASMPRSAQVRATLQPADALAEDDQIALDLAPLRRRRVAVDARCPPTLMAAVATHPALVVAPEEATDVEAALDCGSRPAAGALATVRVLADRTSTPPAGPVQWSSSVAGAGRMALDPTRLPLAAHLPSRPADTVLLAVGDEPVIVVRPGAVMRVETALDFASAAAAGSPDVPLLVNLMFERLFGGRLLDEVAVTERGPAASRVVPVRSLAADATGGLPDQTRKPVDGAWPLLVLAGLVLLWEIAALGRQWVRLRPGAGLEAE